MIFLKQHRFVVSFLCENENRCDSDENIRSLIRFIFEQLQLELCEKNVKARHYSPELIVTNFLWNMTSKNWYEKLRDVFILPTSRRLQQFSCGVNVQSSNVHTKYIEKLAQMLDDWWSVYTSSCIEYMNGKFVGQTQSGEPARMVFAFLCFNLSVESLRMWFTWNRYQNWIVGGPQDLVPRDTILDEGTSSVINVVISTT